MKRKLAAASAKKARAATPAPAKTETKLMTYASGAVFALPLGNKHIFVKIHSKHQPLDGGGGLAESDGKTLFVSNVGQEEAASLKVLLESLLALKVESVECSLPAHRIALVKFAKQIPESKLSTLSREQLAGLELEFNNAGKEGLVERCLATYKRIRPTRTALAEAADQAVIEMEEAAQAAARERNREPIVDEDGFTVVVSKKKLTTGALAAPKRVVKPNSAAKPSKKKAKLAEEDALKFYKFERKRLRKENQIKLKDQFKLDQQKAERIKNELLMNQ